MGQYHAPLSSPNGCKMPCDLGMTPGKVNLKASTRTGRRALMRLCRDRRAEQEQEEDHDHEHNDK